MPTPPDSKDPGTNDPSGEKPDDPIPNMPERPDGSANKPSDSIGSMTETDTVVGPASPVLSNPGANPGGQHAMTTSIHVRQISHGQNKRLKTLRLGEYNLLPDYSNGAAWRKSVSPYNSPTLWGQCTWFAWGRFYELYGFSPRFSGNGYECVKQLLSAHGDKFELSEKPAAGAVFSSDAAHNHVGIVLDYDEATDTLLIQEGNLDGRSNEIWAEAISDYRTIKLNSREIRMLYGNVTYAVPKEGVHFVGYFAKDEKDADAKKMSIRVKSLSELAQSKVEDKIFNAGVKMNHLRHTLDE